MRKVLLYSVLLAAGLAGSQCLAGRGQTVLDGLTLFCLAFIVTRIGYGFELARDKPQKYAWDYVVGLTTTVFPWLFCAAYFALVMAPPGLWRTRDLWWESVLLARFAAPTSVGLLFSMLAAAGLAGTWLYRKARTLAIFDDLDTILLFIPLKVFFLSMNLQLVGLVLIIFGCLWVVWKYVHALNLPVSWPWLLLYSALMVGISEGISQGSKLIDEAAPIKVEVILLAFILGCMLARAPRRARQARNHPADGDLGLESKDEQRVTLIVSACFMALAGLSMPPFSTHAAPVVPEALKPALTFEGAPPVLLARKAQFPGWGLVAVHVLALTALSNLGKMFPALCYRQEASRRESLALAVGMFPRGEVGAGMLVLALSSGITGPAMLVAVLSLALNLLCSGLFVLVIKQLVAPQPRRARQVPTAYGPDSARP